MISEEIVKILTVDAGDSETSVKQMRKEIKLLKDELLNLDETTDDYNKVLGALADRTFALKDMNETVRYSAADLGEQIATVNRIATGLASGFGAVQGTMALFGAESETLEKTMVKLQATIALVQGLQGLEGLTKDLKISVIQFRGCITAVKGFITGLSGLKLALVSTGIGALIVALGALTAAFIANRQEAESYNKILDKIEERQRKLEETNTETIEQTERELKVLQAQGASEEEILNKKLELYKKIAEEQRKLYQENEVKYRALRLEFKDDDSDEAKEILDRAKNAYETSLATYKKYSGKVKDTETDLKVLRIENGRKETENRKKTAEEAVEIEETKANDIKKEINSVQERIHKSLDSEIELRTRQYERERKLFEENNIYTEELTEEFNKDISELQEKKANERFRKIQEDSNKVIEEINKGIAEIQQTANNTIALETVKYNSGETDYDKDPQAAYANEKAYNDAVYQAKVEAIQKENELLQGELNNIHLTAEDRKKIQQELFDNGIRLSNLELEHKKKNDKAEIELEARKQKAKKATLQVASSVFGSLASLAGEATTVGKIAAVASATIDTYQSANAAYKAMAGIPMVGPALGAAAAAAAVVAGLANVKSILSVSTTSASSGGVSAGGSAAAVQPPSLNLVDSMPIQYTRNLLGDSETDEINKDTRVYVLEDDITTTQNKVRVTENNASF